MSTLRPDAFEEIFLKLEEESERRAMEVEEEGLSPNIPDLAAAAQRAARAKQRRRGSVSISRFGHFGDPSQQLSLSNPPTPTAFPDGSTSLSPFYQAQSHNHSADSLSSDSSLEDDAALRAESNHVTQVHRIAGRQSLSRSVGGMLQRTLSRSRSKASLSSNGVDTNVVIGVVVEEDHVEEPSGSREVAPRPESRATAYAHAPRALKSQPSRMTIPGAGTKDPSGSWRSKAADLFRRNSRPRSNTLWAVTPAQHS
ncbi:hypothetical protein BC834DRAFT_486100 [Gloeopeniophorella convolvens]|nr:hypothetical protein BC834DRAFT_486100 [Gloeopeniophorella convolvens]